MFRMFALLIYFSSFCYCCGCTELACSVTTQKIFHIQQFCQRKPTIWWKMRNKIDQFCRLIPIWRPQNLSLEITPLNWIIITGLWFVLHKSTDGWFFFYLQEKEIVYGKGCWCCFFNWKGKWDLVFLWLHTYLQIWVKPAVTWHSFVFGNCSLHTVAIINFFRVGRVGKPYYVLHSEVKEIYK